MKHLVFVVNPKSGVDRVKAIQDTVAQLLDKNIYSYEIQFTECAQHGIELARKAATEGAYAVVAVGGDGSVNDVLCGLYGTNCALAIIPKGSGNGLARSLGIATNVAASIAVLNKGIEVQIDLGIVNEKIFASNAGVGFDALVCKKFARSERRGLAIYAWLITKYLWRYRDWTWEIEVDGKKYERTAFFISVANGKQFGYNFKIAEGASVTDGLLDVVVINKFPKILAALLGLRMLRGTLLKSKYVERFRGKEITISNHKLKLMQKDGDAIECGPVLHYRVVPKAIKVIVGKL